MVPVDAARGDGTTALMAAAQNGAANAVEFLLKTGARVDQTKRNGVTALILGAQAGYPEVLAPLIKAGAKVDQAMNNGWTALMSASQDGHLQAVELLLRSGAWVDQASDTGWTALMSAAQDGRDKVIELLINSGAAVDATMDNGWTALMSAAQDGHLNAVRFLIASGADVSKALKDGWTALMSACEHGHVEVAELLIASGASVNQTTAVGWTALMSAAEDGHADVGEILLKHSAIVDATSNEGDTALLLAAQNGHVTMTELLINAGANVCHAHSDGWTVLMSAAQNGHCEVVSLLIASGVSVSQAKKNGVTVLMIAAWNGQSGVAELLIRAGASVNEKRDDGSTALMNGSQDGHLPVVEILLKSGAVVDLQRNDGFTALMVASQNGHEGVARILLQAGARPALKATSGETALYLSAICSHLTVFRVLSRWMFKYDTADVAEIPSSHIVEGLCCCAMNGEIELIELYLKMRPDVDVSETNSSGFSATELALLGGYSDVVELFSLHGSNAFVSNDTQASRNRTRGTTKLHQYVWDNVPVDSRISPKQWNSDVNSTAGLLGRTPLHHACYRRSIPWARRLIKPGVGEEFVDGQGGIVTLTSADVNIPDLAGWTPLHEACEQNDRQMVELLLDNGAIASVNAETYEGGYTPIELLKNEYVARLLKEKGAVTRFRRRHSVWWPRYGRLFLYSVFFGLIQPLVILSGIFRKTLRFSAQLSATAITIRRPSRMIVAAVLIALLLCVFVAPMYFVTGITAVYMMDWLQLPFGMIIISFMLRVMVKGFMETASKRVMAPSSRVRFNRQNITAVFTLLVETVQLNALVFLLGVPWPKSFYDGFITRLAYSLLTFGPHSYNFTLTVCIILAVIWMVIAGYLGVCVILRHHSLIHNYRRYYFPHITSNFLELVPFLDVFIPLLSNATFMAMIYQTFNAVACDDVEDHSYAVLDVDHDIICWSTYDHRTDVVSAYLVLIWYVPTATILGVQYLDAVSRKLDIRFVPGFEVMTRMLLTTVAMITALWSDLPSLVAPLILIANLVLLVGMIRLRPCRDITWINVWRTFTFASTTWTTMLAVLCMIFSDMHEHTAYIMMSCGWGAAFLLAIVSHIHRKDQAEMMANDPARVPLLVADKASSSGSIQA